MAVVVRSLNPSTTFTPWQNRGFNQKYTSVSSVRAITLQANAGRTCPPTLPSRRQGRPKGGLTASNQDILQEIANSADTKKLDAMASIIPGYTVVISS